MAIIGHDVNGNPIDDSSNVPPVTKNASPIEQTGQDVGGFIDRIMPMLMGGSGTVAGATAGTALGGPIGGIAGGVLGGIGSYLLGKKGINALNGVTGPQQDYSPSLKMSDLSEAGINQAFESGLPLALQGAGKVFNKTNLMDQLLKLTPQQLSDVKGPGSSVSNLEATRATPELSRSVGESIGSNKLQNLEQRLGKQPLSDLRKAQTVEQQSILDKLRGKGTPEQIGKQGQQALSNAYSVSKDNYTDLYDQFNEKVIQPNTNTVKVVVGREPDVQSSVLDASGQPLPAQKGAPITEDRQIALPIHLGTTSSWVQTEGQQINKLLSPDDFENLPPALQSSYNKVKSVLKDAANPTEIMLPDGSTQMIPFKEYDAVKEARTQLGYLLKNAEGIKKKLYTGLRDVLDQDISSTLKAVDPSGNAQGLKNSADVAFGVHQDVIEPVMNRVYKTDPALKQYQDPQEMFKNADTDPAIARQLRAAFRPTDLPILKTGMMSQAIDGAYDSATGLTNVDQLINKITSPGSPYKSVFTPSELTNMEIMLRGMRSQTPNALQSGRSLGFHAGHIALAAISGGAGALTGHDTSSRVEGAVLGAGVILIAPSQFVNRVLLNPTYARIAAQLPKVTAGSQEASLMTKTLLKGALRGTQVLVANGTDAEPTKALIGNDGSIIQQP